MSHILIAMDSFKGSLSAQQACQTIAKAFGALAPHVTLSVQPAADGGEGTAEIIVGACEGRFVTAEGITGPLIGMSVSARFGMIEQNACAVVETAQASGLELLEKSQRNPLLTTTYGTGQLIDAACQEGVKKILLAVGGSATVDGGTGAARALGWRFLNKAGEDVPHGGGFLKDIHLIVPPRPHKSNPKLVVLCDVNNPLCGPTGAARVFARQKGADDRMVDLLEEGLDHLAAVIERDAGVTVLNLPGGGAAGGLAAGAAAFLQATLSSGIEKVMDCLNLKQEIEKADWVVTGEGCFDHQSSYGKVAGRIAAEAKKQGKKVCLIAGRVQVDRQRYMKEGIDIAIECAHSDITDNYAFSHADELLYRAAGLFIKNCIANQSPS